MKLPAALLPLFLLTTGCDRPLPAHSMTFELRALDRDGAPIVPPLLTGADLRDVRAVASSRWYILSGRHTRSQLVLTVRPEALERWRLGVTEVASRGGRLALVMDGVAVGEMIVQRSPVDSEFAIDASFFSGGTEREKAADTRRLARQIRASLP